MSLRREGAQGTFSKKVHQKGEAQGSLEYIIIIGGIIIIAAATYFMLRGFSQTSKTTTNDTIGSVFDIYGSELEDIAGVGGEEGAPPGWSFSGASYNMIFLLMELISVLHLLESL
jgi:hypothetical protein